MKAVDPRAAAALVEASLAATIALHDEVRRSGMPELTAAAAAVVASLAQGGKLLLFGNGGSAADAQHVAAELVWRFNRTRPAIGALALTADGSVLTSIANDAGYVEVFARQVEALGRPGDVALGLSTSGRSANIVRALEAARGAGLTTIALTGGDGGPVGAAADIHINVPSASVPRVQEVHRTLLHVFCDLLEQALDTRVR